MYSSRANVLRLKSKRARVADNNMWTAPMDNDVILPGKPFGEADEAEADEVQKALDLLYAAQQTLEQLNTMSQKRVGRALTPYRTYVGQLDDMMRSIRRISSGEWAQDSRRGGEGQPKRGYERRGNRYYKVVLQPAKKSEACVKSKR